MDGNRNEKPWAVGEKKKEIGGHFSVDAKKKQKWDQMFRNYLQLRVVNILPVPQTNGVVAVCYFDVWVNSIKYYLVVVSLQPELFRRIQPSGIWSEWLFFSILPRLACSWAAILDGEKRRWLAPFRPMPWDPGWEGLPGRRSLREAVRVGQPPSRKGKKQSQGLVLPSVVLRKQTGKGKAWLSLAGHLLRVIVVS